MLDFENRGGGPLRKSNLLKLLSIIFAFALIAGACGGDDDDSGSSSDSSVLGEDSSEEEASASASETAEEKATLENSREKQISKIDSNTIQIYSKVISARSGVAVVPLSGDSCGGCGAALPIQMASEIRAGKTHTCFNCGRFVYGKKN